MRRNRLPRCCHINISFPFYFKPICSLFIGHPNNPPGIKKESGNFRSRILCKYNDCQRDYERAAGFFDAWSRIVVSTLFGTCSKFSGSIE